LGGSTTVRKFEYDPLGRLFRVRDGQDNLVREFSYDGNGNRVAVSGSESASATYDAQDRLLSYTLDQVTTSYTYTPHGQLASSTVGSDTTLFEYDARGSLRSVELPDGPVVEYLIDGLGRRVGVLEDGTLVRQYVYRDDLNIA